MSRSSRSARDNRANQLNPNHPAFRLSRGVRSDEGQRAAVPSTAALDNRANQLNPNNAAYAASRSGSKASPPSSNPSSAKPEQSEQHSLSRAHRPTGVRALGGRP